MSITQAVLDGPETNYDKMRADPVLAGLFLQLIEITEQIDARMGASSPPISVTEIKIVKARLRAIAGGKR